MTTAHHGLLYDVRVIDLATERAEYAGRLLADLGAEVIKIEPPGGATARTWGPFANDGSEPASLYWATVGMGKKSVVLDVEQAADRAELLRLVDTADVFIESHDPGYLASLGLGYDDLKARNERLVYVSVTPYGQDGPDAHSPASELVLEAAGGRGTQQGEPDRPPLPLGYPQTYFHAGAQAATDAALALYERDRSGKGQYLDVSIQSVMVWTLLVSTCYPSVVGDDAPNSGPYRANAGQIADPAFRGIARSKAQVKDGWVNTTFGLGAVGAHSIDYCMKWAEREGQLPEEFQGRDWTTWQVELAGGSLDQNFVDRAGEAMWAFLGTRTKRELMDAAASQQLFLAPIFNIADVLEDPHLAAREFWVEVAGRTHPGAFAHLSRAAVVPTAPAPALDADRAILDQVREVPELKPKAPGDQRKGILDGVKVADFSWLGVGPINGQALAVHGATVVRVESETRPDLLRYLGPYLDNQPGINRSQFYANFNNSKLGLALNTATDEGKKIARELVDWADIVIEAFRPGVMARMGIDYDTLVHDKPDLIMLSTCIRGQIGPEKNFPGTGAQGGALCGIESITGWPDRPPCGVHGAYTDVVVPRFTVGTIAAALYNRDRTGHGVHIDAAQVDPGIKFLEPLVLDYTVNGNVAGPMGQASLYSCPRGIYKGKGTERYIAIEIETADQWRALRTVAPLQDFDDPGFETLEARINHRELLDQVMADWVIHNDVFKLAEKLKAAGVPASVAYWPSDLYKDPQLTHRDFFQKLTHTEMGTVYYDGVATHFSETPAKLRKAAPCLGEDTDQIMREILGYTSDQVADLAVAGVFQ